MDKIRKIGQYWTKQTKILTVRKFRQKYVDNFSRYCCLCGEIVIVSGVQHGYAKNSRIMHRDILPIP